MPEKQRIEDLKSHSNCPKHIAIIMDGNGRWAKSKGLLRTFGHDEGVNSVRDIIDVSVKMNIEHLTLYTFSTENWNRPKWEVTALMKLLVSTLNKEVKNLMKMNVKVHMIGGIDDLPKSVAKSMLKSIDETKNNTGLQLNIALNYSSRSEIINAVQQIVKKANNNDVKPEDVTDKLFESHLYTANIPDPDLLIRTSGEYRISNFLLWQIAYSEIYITDVLWPEFRKSDYLDAIGCFVHRERRYGLVSEQIEKKDDV